LPDLFREGQGIVANGNLDKNGVFQAREVMAKHDENYMPPEVADALGKQVHVNTEFISNVIKLGKSTLGTKPQNNSTERKFTINAAMH
jgi:cytochrome c-type biogenesis protein CcmE